MHDPTILFSIIAILSGAILFDYTRKQISDFFKALELSKSKRQKDKELQRLLEAAKQQKATASLITSPPFELKKLLQLASIQELETFNLAITEMETAIATTRKAYNETLNEIYKNTNLKIATPTNNNAATNKPNNNSSAMLESIAKGMNLSSGELLNKLKAHKINNADEFAALGKEERKSILDEIKNS